MVLQWKQLPCAWDANVSPRHSRPRCSFATREHGERWNASDFRFVRQHTNCPSRTQTHTHVNPGADAILKEM